mmetsp:Transcript_33108/g.72996  ORF Transcript_33108/g.72996 Transcript_33108/m.72996 type:complete len:292 (-) Transcript_33108:238-1113(-)
MATTALQRAATARIRSSLCATSPLIPCEMLYNDGLSRNWPAAITSKASFHAIAPTGVSFGPITQQHLHAEQPAAVVSASAAPVAAPIICNSSILGRPFDSLLTTSVSTANLRIRNNISLQQRRGFVHRSSQDELTQAEIVAIEEAIEADVDADVGDEEDDGGPVSMAPRDRSNPIHSYTEDITQMDNDELANPDTIPGWDLIHSPPRKFPRGALVGKVVSDKMQKTVSVAVDRYRVIPKLRIRRRYTRKFMAHDEDELCQMGDLVMIVPCQRLSRHKHFMVREIIRAKGAL